LDGRSQSKTPYFPLLMITYAKYNPASALEPLG
jgi:hypothetical protein